MSSFYGQLAKEALGEDVSDVSEGELDEMLANMEDLDAGLFGLSSLPKTPDQKPTVPKIKESTPQPPRATSKKSDLLAELFGNDDDDEIIRAPSPPAVYKLEPSKPMEIKSEAVENAPLSGSYLPLSGERRRRVAPPLAKPVENLWDDFLQPAAPEPKPQIETPVAMERQKEITQLRARTEEKISVPQPEVRIDKEELMKELAELIREEQNKMKEETVAKFESSLQELRDENIQLRETIDEFREQFFVQDNLIQSLREENNMRNDVLQAKIDECSSALENKLLEQRDQLRERLSDLLCQTSQLEEQLRDVQHATDTMQSTQQSSIEKQAKKQAKLEEEIKKFEEHLNQVREAAVEENKIFRKSVEQKLLKISGELGDFEILEGRTAVLEQRVKKLVSSTSEARHEQEVVKKLEMSESGMLQKLNYCSNQQVRHESWHQQQLSDLAAHVEQRLWGLHRHVELNASGVKGEMGSLRGDMESRLGEMEAKVARAENETCRLNRLAERLCGLLQLWEMRNKESSKIQELMEQSFRERYAMAMEQKLSNQHH